MRRQASSRLHTPGLAGMAGAGPGPCRCPTIAPVARVTAARRAISIAPGGGGQVRGRPWRGAPVRTPGPSRGRGCPAIDQCVPHPTVSLASSLGPTPTPTGGTCLQTGAFGRGAQATTKFRPRDSPYTSQAWAPRRHAAGPSAVCHGRGPAPGRGTRCRGRGIRRRAHFTRPRQGATAAVQPRGETTARRARPRRRPTCRASGHRPTAWGPAPASDGPAGGGHGPAPVTGARPAGT